MKPPKSWLTEYAQNHRHQGHQKDHIGSDGDGVANNRSKASFGSNMDNSFRHYMAKKIHRQRDQFGLVLPPPPTPMDDHDHGNADVNDANDNDTCEKDDANPDLHQADNSNHSTFMSSARSRKDYCEGEGEGEGEDGGKKKKSDEIRQVSTSHHDRRKEEEEMKEEEKGCIIEPTCTTMAGLLGRLKKKNKRRSGSAAQLARRRDRKKRRHHEGQPELELPIASVPVPAEAEIEIETEIGTEMQETHRDVRLNLNQSISELGSNVDFSSNNCSMGEAQVETDIEGGEIDMGEKMRERHSRSIMDVDGIFFRQQNYRYAPLTQIDLSQEITRDDGDNKIEEEEMEMMGRELDKEYERAPLTPDNLSRQDVGRTGGSKEDKTEDEGIRGKYEDGENDDSCLVPGPRSKQPAARPTSPSSKTSPSPLSSSPPKCVGIDSMRQLKRQRKDLFFLGVTVLVNGYTDPCADTLMRTLHRHGGNLEKYETSRVTHIIAESLSTAKAKIYKRQKRPIPVVKPSWVVDCAKEGMLLPYVDHLLDEVRDEDHVWSASFKDYFRVKEKDIGEAKSSSVVVKETDQKNPPELDDAGVDINPAVVNVPELDKVIILDQGSGKNNTDTCPVSATISNIPNTAKGTNEIKCKATSSRRHGFSGGHRTVGTDPDFLQSYFDNSRLSFIGSFKLRLEHNKIETNHRAMIRCDDAKRFVFHIDMDCFFAAIALRKFPQFRNKPVAVSHAWKNDPNGIRANEATCRTNFNHGKESNSELSTCNYEARKYGVRKGMFLSRAKTLCPELVVLPYDYEGYKDAARKTGEILQGVVTKYNGAMEQRSCDESYIELFLLEGTDDGNSLAVIDLAKSIGDKIREDIYSAVECTASVGIGDNKLLAKLATNNVKNQGGNGVFVIAGEGKRLLNKLALKDLEGIGYRLNQKLLSRNLSYVQDVLDMHNGKEELCQILGPGNGSKIYNYCYGIDNRPIENTERKTIGAECNYGVRFDGPYGVDYMMKGLAKEVEKRMKAVGVVGRHITVKVKERQSGAPPPGKFNGHGKCNDHSKSLALPGICAIRDGEIIAQEGMKLFHEIGVKKNEVRGMGIVISKLEMEKSQPGEGQLSSWLNFKNRVSTECLHKSGTIENRAESHQKHAQKLLSIGASGRAIIEEKYNCESYSKDPTVENFDQGVQIMDVDWAEKNNLKIVSRNDENAQAISHSRVVTHRISGTKKNKYHTQAVKRPSAKVAKSDGRYRQYDVKSMLKLASIKSGEDKLSLDGQQVSLSQLGSLPLDIQLQVANDEGDCQNIHTKSKSTISKKEIIEIDDMSVFSEDSEDAEYDKESDDGTQNLDQRNDILVLRQWMDEHQEPSPDDVELVEDFLCVCVSENRLDDVASMLRLIKMRSDQWGWNYYEVLLKKTEKAIKSFLGKSLDLNWLGLLP